MTKENIKNLNISFILIFKNNKNINFIKIFVFNSKIQNILLMEHQKSDRKTQSYKRL